MRDGDPCPVCGSALVSARGIEMGHIFQLGRKYADALGLQVLDENGALVTVTMGSYGVGVSRAVAAVAENAHDDKGLIWPREVAPADVHIVIAGKGDEITEAAELIAGGLDASGVRVLLDDRTASVGRQVHRRGAARRADHLRRRPRAWRRAWWRCGTGRPARSRSVSIAEIVERLREIVRGGR